MVTDSFMTYYMNNIRFAIHTVVFNFFFFLVYKYLVRSFESLMMLRPLRICNFGLHRRFIAVLRLHDNYLVFYFLFLENKTRGKCFHITMDYLTRESE